MDFPISVQGFFYGQFFGMGCPVFRRWHIHVVFQNHSRRCICPAQCTRSGNETQLFWPGFKYGILGTAHSICTRTSFFKPCRFWSVATLYGDWIDAGHAGGRSVNPAYWLPYFNRNRAGSSDDHSAITDGIWYCLKHGDCAIYLWYCGGCIWCGH